MLRIAFGLFFLSDLWASWAVSGASWDVWRRLGAAGGVLEPAWHDLGAVLGRPWGVLGRLGASWGRLGSVLGHLGSVSGQFPRTTSIFDRFLLPTSTSET